MGDTDPTPKVYANADGRYVYGVVALPCEPLGPLAGIEGAPVRLVTGSSFAALVHDVAHSLPVDDAAQLTRWAEAHHRILTAVMAGSAVVIPARLGTCLQGGDPATLTWLEDQQPLLAALAERLRGQNEFLIRVYWDPTAARQEVVALSSRLGVPEAPGGHLPPGSAFLHGRRREKALGEAVERIAAHCREQALHVLRTYASDLRLGAAERTLESRDSGALLEAACLLGTGGSEQLAAAFARLDLPSGMTVRLVGPWPAYDFAG